MKILQIFKQRWFLINFGGAILSVWIVAHFSMNWVEEYTNHGFKIEVPDLSGYPLEEIPILLDSLNLRFEVIDSVYNSSTDFGVVLDQNPVAKSFVKDNRTIYLTINSRTPPMVRMPNLVNLSLRQALNILAVLGLESDRLEYRPDICTDCVLAQKWDDQKINPGTRLKKGEKITLVLGKGRTNEFIRIPNVIGNQLEKAVITLFEKSLNVGSVVLYDFCSTSKDSANAVVFQQRPNHSVPMGSQVDLWFTCNMDKTKDRILDEAVK
ncbi:MAG: beta-lactam-binding protein with PASTA domain [Luteibaculaceae bacterium]|jgi:beta-lactam-binding protein with PASTA domain